MPYLLDSDIVIDHLAENRAATTLLEQLAPEGIAVSIITYMETYQGVLRSSQTEHARSKFQSFLATVPVLPFSLTAAERCAQLRETFRSQGRRVKARALDLLTAAIALEYGLILVTRNVEDYDDIPDLQLHQAG